MKTIVENGSKRSHALVPKDQAFGRPASPGSKDQRLDPPNGKVNTRRGVPVLRGQGYLRVGKATLFLFGRGICFVG